MTYLGHPNDLFGTPMHYLMMTYLGCCDKYYAYVCVYILSGDRSSVIHSVLRLGIALLEEGNSQIQSQMLSQLHGMDVGFLASVGRLISRCSVLDWNAYERYQKSELMHSSTSLG